jgi:hypothetical protein
MNIPNYLTDKLVDENGELTTPWARSISQLLVELETNLSNEGYVLPQQPTTNINLINEQPKTEGTMIWDSTTKQMKVNDGTNWKVVTLT